MHYLYPCHQCIPLHLDAKIHQIHLCHVQWYLGQENKSGDRFGEGEKEKWIEQKIGHISN